MVCSRLNITDLDSLRLFINTTLCHHDQLELNAFPLTEQTLVRGGKPCGMFFCLHGPRSVRITAIWETEHNVVLFYDSSGERFSTIRLLDAPELPSEAFSREPLAAKA